MEIGLRCGLYDRETMTILRVTESTDETELLQSLNEHVDTLISTPEASLVMAVAGKSLPVIYQSKELSELIKLLFMNCEAVIVYRSSPSQKAETVTYIRKNIENQWFSNLTTMAIGDGANDVNMIQSAHIGIGIFGKEGNQAASFADYALPSFRDLRQLLFWHGRSMGVKSTNFACWFAYKGMLFSVPLIFFNAYTAFSGLTYVEDYFYALYEVILTTWAIGGYLLFEYDVDSFFKSSQNGGLYLANHYKHCKEEYVGNIYERLTNWCLFSWYSGAVLFYVSFYAYDGPVNETGKIDGVWTAGFASFSILIAVHHLTIFMSTKSFNVWLIGSFIFSILCFMPIAIYLNEYSAGTMMYMTTISDVLFSPLYALVVLCGTMLIIVPYYACIRYDEFKKYPEFSSATQAEIARTGDITIQRKGASVSFDTSPMKTHQCLKDDIEDDERDLETCRRIIK